MQIIFEKHPEIIAGLSERSDGSMVWWNKLPVDEKIRNNRDAFFVKNKIDVHRVIAGGIVHGNYVAVVGETAAGKYFPNTDALITDTPGLFLSITAADCLPVFFYERMTKCVGIAHAGWRGLVEGILENTVRELQRTFGARPENLQVIIGPHIRSCHYEVGKEVAEQFAAANIEKHDGHLFIKLAGEAEMRLRASGVADISISSECTFEEPEKFFSARRDQSEPLEGMVAFIGLQE